MIAEPGLKTITETNKQEIQEKPQVNTPDTYLVESGSEERWGRLQLKTTVEITLKVIVSGNSEASQKDKNQLNRLYSDDQEQKLNKQ